MSAYPGGTTYSVTLVTAHAQCILVNHKVKGCLHMSHKKSLEPCERCYSVPYKRNSTTRMRSDTNITNLGWNNILLRKKWKITKLHAYISKNARLFLPIRSGIKTWRWRRPRKCDHVGKQHWGGPGISMATKMSQNFKIDTVSCSPKRSLWSLTIGRLSQSIMEQWPHQALLMN